MPCLCCSIQGDDLQTVQFGGSECAAFYKLVSLMWWNVGCHHHRSGSIHDGEKPSSDKWFSYGVFLAVHSKLIFSFQSAEYALLAKLVFSPELSMRTVSTCGSLTAI